MSKSGPGFLTPSCAIDWGTPKWAIEIAKALEASLKWLIGDYDCIGYVGEGAYSMVVKVNNGLQDYAVKLLIYKEARTDQIHFRIQHAGGRDAYVKEWEKKCQELLDAEVQKMMRLNECRYVVPYVGCGKGEVEQQLFPLPVFYLVMKFIEGSSLEEFSPNNRLVPTQCLEIAIQLLRAIEYATTKIQENGKPIAIIHRDIDWDNIAVREVLIEKGLPSLLQIVVLDYGIARIQDVTAHGPSTSAWEMKRPTLPWETWFPGKESYRFGVFTDTYSVGMILLDLLFLNRDKDSQTSGMPAPTFQLQSLRTGGLFDLDVPDYERKDNFKKFLNLYLPHIHLEEDQAEADPTSPTKRLRRVLERALAFGSLNEKKELIFGNNERYHNAREMLNELNAIRLEAFYRQAQRLLADKEYLLYEANKRRLEMAMQWDSPEDEWAWNLLGMKLFNLNDEEAAYACFSEVIRIAEQWDRPFPKAYRNRAKLCEVIACETPSASKAMLYGERAKADKESAEEAEERLRSVQASVLPPAVPTNTT